MIQIVKTLLIYLILGCISTIFYEVFIRPRNMKAVAEGEPRVREFVIFWPFLWLGMIIGAINCLKKRK